MWVMKVLLTILILFVEKSFTSNEDKFKKKESYIRPIDEEEYSTLLNSFKGFQGVYSNVITM